MMDSLLSIVLLTGALARSARKKQATLEGAVAGLPDGEVQLQNQTGVVKTSRLTDGKFRMEVTTSFPNDYFLLFGNGHRIPLVIEKEYIFVDIDFYDDPTFVKITQFSTSKNLPVPVLATEK